METLHGGNRIRTAWAGFVILLPIISSHFITGQPRAPLVLTGDTNANPSAPLLTGCGGEFVSAVDSAREQTLVELVNAERSKRNLPPLKRVDGLMDAARYHAVDMVQDDYFKHDTYDRSADSLTKVCLWYERINSFYSQWSRLGENIAAGPNDPQSALDMWMNSEPHRANILSADYWEIGIGYANGMSSFGAYWVQDFGRRWDVYPIVVAGEAASTDNREVDLYIYGEWSEMRLRNDNLAWSAWTPFQPAVQWRLPPTKGYHTVYVEMKTDASSATSSDRIYLTIGAEPTPSPYTEAIFMPLILK